MTLRDGRLKEENCKETNAICTVSLPVSNQMSLFSPGYDIRYLFTPSGYFCPKPITEDTVEWGGVRVQCGSRDCRKHALQSTKRSITDGQGDRSEPGGVTSERSPKAKLSSFPSLMNMGRRL